MGEVSLVGERDLHLVGERPGLRLPFPKELHVVGLAHVEVEIDRVGGDERGQ